MEYKWSLHKRKTCCFLVYKLIYMCIEKRNKVNHSLEVDGVPLNVYFDHKKVKNVQEYILNCSSCCNF